MLFTPTQWNKACVWMLSAILTGFDCTPWPWQLWYPSYGGDGGATIVPSSKSFRVSLPVPLAGVRAYEVESLRTPVEIQSVACGTAGAGLSTPRCLAASLVVGIASPPLPFHPDVIHVAAVDALGNIRVARRRITVAEPAPGKRCRTEAGQAALDASSVAVRVGGVTESGWAGVAMCPGNSSQVGDVHSLHAARRLRGRVAGNR